MDIVPRRLRRLARVGGGLLVLTALAGALYEQVSERRGTKRFPRIGRAVDIGGRSLNLFCEGAGTPVVVFESGKLLPGYFWQVISRQVSAFTEACWYDRAGLGWSGPAPVPHRGDSIASDLHRLLEAARVPAPYVLVGHSYGGFYVRVFNGRYPRDVAGLVLVDPESEDIATRMPSVPHHGPPLGLSQRAMARVATVVSLFGLPRLMRSRAGPLPEQWTSLDWERLAYLGSRPQAMIAGIAEGPYQVLGHEARAAGGFGDRPLIVLSATRDELPPDALREKTVIHGELARQSSRGQLITVPTGHFIPLEAPDVVVRAIRTVVEAARRYAAPSRNSHR